MAGGVAVALAASAVGLKAWIDEWRADASLRRRLAAVQPIPPHSSGCEGWLAGRTPVVVMALGQSNAGNHADLPPGDGRGHMQPRPVAVLHEGRCVMASDPLPGGTGHGASLWRALDQRLAGQWGGQPIVWSVELAPPLPASPAPQGAPRGPAKPDPQSPLGQTGGARLGAGADAV